MNNKFFQAKLSENESRGKLFFMIGLPRAGKSTVTKKLEKEFNAVVLTADSFRLALYNSDYHHESEPQVFAALDTAARALIISGRNVIIDDTHTLSYKRSHWVAMGGVGIYVNTDEKTCLSRCPIEYDGLYKTIQRTAENLRSFHFEDSKESIERVYSQHGDVIWQPGYELQKV